MCAICGVIQFNGAPVEAARLETMRDVMVHRGPDHGGLWIGEGVGLGHRRLKIIDLSPAGNQPMGNEDGQIQVVFNGEVYNFPELRAQLSGRHEFRSRSDTEVIVHGYEEWGTDVFAKLDGMFAIGLWDARTRTLMLARDRWGKKPLFYARRQVGGEDEVLFASDIKAIRAALPHDLTLDPTAIDAFFHHLSPGQDRCIFREVAKVQPAHFETFTATEHRAERFWQADYSKKIHLSEPEALEQTDALLRQAIKRRLESDVPLGAFLSGGVDSSLVVALMSQIQSGRTKTFSIGFAEEDFSELPYARAVAERYNTEHQEIQVAPDMLSVLPSLVWEYGEPFGDSSAIPTFYVSQAAREFVTVAFTGDGGDEVFGGYDVARASYHAERLHQLMPKAVRHWIEGVVFSRPRSGVLGKLRTLLVHGSEDPAIRHTATLGFSPAQKASLYTPEFTAALGDYAPHQFFAPFYPQIRGWSLIDQNLFLTQMGRLANDYLIKVDVASMKVALELRSPFLDTTLAEFSHTLDPRLKVRGGQQKYLLKRLAERYIPHDAIYRKKAGFSLPLTHWLRGPLGDTVAPLLLEGEISRTGWFHRAAIETLIAEHRTKAKDHTHRLYLLLWLELWWRLFITRTLQPTDSLKG
jgi:asparagine synthase (glutamine-hydrolysing)